LFSTFIGSCSESAEVAEACVPVIGHLAAFVKRNASADVMTATKDIILSHIKDDMTARNDHSNLTQHIIFVSEHGNEPQHHPNNHDLVGDFNDSSNTILIACFVIAILVLAAMFDVTVGLLWKRKRGNNQKEEEPSASSVVNRKSISLCEQGLTGKDASDGEKSCDDRNNLDSFSKSSDDTPFANVIPTLHPDENTQPIIPSRQQLNGTSEHEGDIINHAEWLPGEYASDGDNSSGSFSENSSTMSESTVSTNEKFPQTQTHV